MPAISNYEEDATFMEKAEFNLTTIRRQALDSPIIRLSIDIRTGKYVPNGKYGPGVFVIDWDEITDDLLLKSDQIICGKNNTRQFINQEIRSLRGYDLDSMPVDGERIIGLNNILDKGLYNGQQWTVNSDYSNYPISGASSTVMNISDDINHTSIARCAFPQDMIFKKSNSREAALHYMRENGIYAVDFGAAITCHKSQGSSFMRPIAVDEYMGNKEFMTKWRYTAVTRAVKKLIWARNF